MSVVLLTQHTLYVTTLLPALSNPSTEVSVDFTGYNIVFL